VFKNDLAVISDSADHTFKVVRKASDNLFICVWAFAPNDVVKRALDLLGCWGTLLNHKLGGRPSVVRRDDPLGDTLTFVAERANNDVNLAALRGGGSRTDA
jgi:hypothetical protein